MVGVLLQQREYIDVIIPRGGAGLIRRVVEEVVFLLLKLVVVYVIRS